MVRTIALSLMLAVMIFLIPTAQSVDAPLKFAEAQPAEINGMFSLILFDSAWGGGIQRIAILDAEQDDVIIEPYVPVDEYRIIRHLPAADAYRQALAFLSLAPDFWSSQLTRISDARGTLLGYEVRPLFFRLTYGKPDVLDVNYRLKGNTIYMHIRLIDEVDRRIRGVDY